MCGRFPQMLIKVAWDLLSPCYSLITLCPLFFLLHTLSPPLFSLLHTLLKFHTILILYLYFIISLSYHYYCGCSNIAHVLGVPQILVSILLYKARMDLTVLSLCHTFNFQFYSCIVLYHNFFCLQHDLNPRYQES